MRNKTDAATPIENLDLLWYTGVVRGGVDQLTDKQKSELLDVAMLVFDYDRLRNFIK